MCLCVSVSFFHFRISGPAGRRLVKALSLRELEYLQLIRKKNISLYGEVIRKLDEVIRKLEDNISAPDVSDELYL